MASLFWRLVKATFYLVVAIGMGLLAALVIGPWLLKKALGL